MSSGFFLEFPRLLRVITSINKLFRILFREYTKERSICLLVREYNSVMPVMIIERRRSAECMSMRPLLSLITNSDKELEKQGGIVSPWEKDWVISGVARLPSNRKEMHFLRKIIRYAVVIIISSRH